MKFWPKVFLVLFYVKQLQIDPKKDVWKFWDKKKSFLAGLQVLQIFVSKVMQFWVQYFWVVLIGNNNKMIENDVGKVWVQNSVILGWFPTLASFHAESHQILTWTFLSRTDKKW